MDLLDYNKGAWDHSVTTGNRWTVAVDEATIARARGGDWNVALVGTTPVPRAWFGELHRADVLCLASGGGQQGPVLSAAGAHVTVYDLSPKQLAQDRCVAQRDGLNLKTVQGDMCDLSAFEDGSFDLVFHPVSNCFAPDVLPLWREAFRVLRPGGSLLAGFINPTHYIFDELEAEKGNLTVRHKLPFSDLTSLSEEERQQYVDKQEPLNFGHSLKDQIGGQLSAGFILTGYSEEEWEGTALSKYMPEYIATRALKPN